MEFVDGGSLDRKLNGTPLPPYNAARWLELLARAVHAAHVRGIVHRDLKPANILLSISREPPASAHSAFAGGSRLNQADPKITDFGLAKRLGVDSGQSRSGILMGTPSYMAPEQAAGKRKEIGPAADVYALGGVLYEMLTGRPPFRGATALDTAEQVRRHEPVSPRRLQPTVPHDLQTICLKCLRKDPARRYQSAVALADDLRRFREGKPIAARPVTQAERSVKWVRRNPVVAALVSTVLFVLATGIAASWLAGRQALDALRQEEHARRNRAGALVQALLKANPQAVPEILRSLESYSPDVLPPLRRLWEEENGLERRALRLRAGLALLPAYPDVKDRLAEWMLQVADPYELLLVRDALRPHGVELKERLWQQWDDAQADPDLRFRTACALAAFDPKDPRWAQRGREVAQQLVAEDPLTLGPWIQGFRPVKDQLVGPLRDIYRDAQRSKEERRMARTLLAAYARDQTEAFTEREGLSEPRP
jgi:hypothetical protein